MISFQNKVVLITGSTRGIGESTANLFENAGAQLILTGTKENEIKKLNDKLKIKNEQLIVEI